MEKEIKLSERELLVLIKQFSQIELILNLEKISLRILDERFIELAKKLAIKEIEYIAKDLAETILIQENYPCDKDIHCCISFENMDINLNMKIKKGQTTKDYVHYDEEEDTIIDARDDEIEAIYDDMFEEQERRELKDLEQYEEQVRESDEINHKIQAEMEQYMFENGKDYEDYQEPQSYDTEEDLVDNPAKDDEPVDIDELNNDLDEALKQ